MPNQYKEPGALVLTLFDNLIERIKSRRPIRTNGKPLTTGFVYSQLVLGMPCDPRDYMNAWSPAGGGTVQDAVQKLQPAPTAQPAPGQPPAGSATAAPALDTKLQKAINAAWKTSRLVDTMIMVTNDDSFLEYPAARHISFAYEGIINGMQSLPTPPISPEVQKQIDDARKVLFELDEEASIVSKSRLYKNYIKNAEAYALAKTDYAVAQATTLANPAVAASWPLMSGGYQQKVDNAYDTLKTEGAEKVERSLDILESVGINMQNHMIAKARKLFDVWNLSGLSGVPDRTPYSYISPSGWCDPDADDEGWQTLTVSHNEYRSRSSFHSSSFADSRFRSDQSSSGGGGGVSIFGFGGHGSASSSSSSWSSSYQSQSGSRYEFHNDAKNLSITISYALCTINRPWLVGDLFYLRNWYLVGNPKNAVSDGTIDGQVEDKKALMPMIPVQFLVIRNVKIHATAADWGGDGQTLLKMQADSQSQSSSSSSGGGGGFSLGFISIGGEGSHSEGHTSSSFSNSQSEDANSNYGWSFDGQTLEIKGAQIVAFLSQIVPASAPLGDPGLNQ
jgi:hypothetical protein